MSTKVLVVCGSDACLAPAAAFALRSGLLDAGGVEAVEVGTAGVRAEPGGSLCAEAARAMVGSGSPEPRWAHHPRQITAAVVAEAEVILATERRYRSAPRVLDVHSAHRTFTVLEAAVLGAAVLQRRGSDLAAQARHARVAQDAASQFAWLVEEMDSLRGLVTMPAQRHRWLGRTPRSLVVGIDVLDPHTVGGSHRQALAALDRAMRTFAVTVAAVTTRTVPV
ncbi:hypothetical protein [Phycicoccus sp. Root563]|uniref:hypothetical protein n=1 Tax=Phycicoccus sp. Root563 TaxID=1736562 RepID=UPI000AC48666|nr:hypothetical protein [Phycicoccus sp. Root563]